MKSHILFADPNIAFRALYTKVLETEGYEVSAVSDMSALFSFLRARGTDLLVLDPALLGSQGVVILRRLLTHLSGQRVVLFSSLPHPQWIELACELGAADYLLKGKISPNQFLARLDEILTWIEGEEKPRPDERLRETLASTFRSSFRFRETHVIIYDCY